IDREGQPWADTHLQDAQIRLRQRHFAPERRRARAQLRQRRPQIPDQVPQQHGRLLRVRFRQVLHRSERIEQEMRLDLRLHKLSSASIACFDSRWRSASALCSAAAARASRRLTKNISPMESPVTKDASTLNRNPEGIVRTYWSE